MGAAAACLQNMAPRVLRDAFEHGQLVVFDVDLEQSHL